MLALPNHDAAEVGDTQGNIANCNGKLHQQRILYITYDGILEPLGYSQVLRYLTRLAPGRQIALISFEKREDWMDIARRRGMTAEIARAQIKWIALTYHKRPTILATTWDVLRALIVSLYLVSRYRIAVVHARSYVPSLIALTLKRVSRTRFIFDMRGFWADERVDGGLWRQDSRLYRWAKSLERRFLTQADAVISLTHSAVTEMRKFDYLRGREPDFHVISTCTDLEAFRPRKKHYPVGGLTLGYVGTAGTWYLMDPAAECFRLFLEVDPRGLERVEMKAVTATEMPEEIGAIDAAVFFIKPVFSKKASAPTKLGELLAAGIPCLTGAGIGDVDEILHAERVGIVVERVDAQELAQAVESLIALAREPDISTRCRAAARRYFSLDMGVQAYARVYDALSP